MIPCICIDASSKPNEIPKSKWIKEGKKYHVIYTTIVLPQRELAFHLSEIQLTDNELPYEYFLGSRFAFNEQDINKLMQLIEDCSDTDFSVVELMAQIGNNVSLNEQGSTKAV
jgi:hypothetical protein